MKNPPIWKHLRDIYQFKESQPTEMTSRRVLGVTQPNHVRIFWGQDGGVLLQSKHWLTSPDWSEPLVLLDASQVRLLAFKWPALQQPCWDDDFVGKSLNWFEKLRNLLQQAKRSTEGIDHCIRLVKHEELSFLPGEHDLQTKVASILKNALQNNPGRAGPSAPPPSAGLRAAMAKAFPGSSGSSSGYIRLASGSASSQSGFCIEELSEGQLVLVRGLGRSDLPVMVATVLQIIRENPQRKPVAAVRCWQPQLKPDKYKGPNLFGTWFPSSEAVAVGAGSSKRLKTGSAPVRMVNLEDVLAWPLDLEQKPGAQQGVGQIPFAALHYLRESGKADVSAKKYTFSKRGNAFFLQVAKRTAQYLRDAGTG